MYPRTPSVHLRLSPPQSEFLYWELLGLLAYYAGNGATIEPADEQALRLAISQLESELARASAQADIQLAQLRRLATHQESP
jgi:hypothetical protein